MQRAGSERSEPALLHFSGVFRRFRDLGLAGGTCPLFAKAAAGHVHPLTPGVDIYPLCPSPNWSAGHVRRSRGGCDGHVLCTQTLLQDMSIVRRGSCRTCPSFDARSGHIPTMSIAQLERWACPAI